MNTNPVNPTNKINRNQLKINHIRMQTQYQNHLAFISFNYLIFIIGHLNHRLSSQTILLSKPILVFQLLYLETKTTSPLTL